MIQFLGEKGRRGKRREVNQERLQSSIPKVRVSLAYNSIKHVIHVIIIDKYRNDFRELEN